MSIIARGPAYKEMTLQQLRSFCETARLGSLKAAADVLGLAHPTVWQQVHALERELATRLVEPHGRGCRLIAEGELLAKLASPLVAGFNALPRDFQEASAQVRPRLTVATTQRTLIEDLRPVIVAFEQRFPDVLLRLREVTTEEVIAQVESGAADLGLTAHSVPASLHARLRFEPAYELDLILVTPRDHPLARKRRLGPKDLLPFPLVNAPGNIPDPAINSILGKLGVFETEPRRVEAHYTATICHCVELGFGIGLIVGLPSRVSNRRLHERSMSRHFGRLTVNLVWRKGTQVSGLARAFADTVKTQLSRKKAHSAHKTVSS